MHEPDRPVRQWIRREDAKAFPRSRPFYEEPLEMEDGSRYQGWHVLSTFKTLFDFKDYPRDRHVLAMDVEDNSNNATAVVYEVAAADVQYDTGNRDVLGGWRIERAPWAHRRRERLQDRLRRGRRGRVDDLQPRDVPPRTDPPGRSDT